jgi:hypothetical protein
MFNSRWALRPISSGVENFFPPPRPPQMSNSLGHNLHRPVSAEDPRAPPAPWERFFSCQPRTTEEGNFISAAFSWPLVATAKDIAEFWPFLDAKRTHPVG